MNVFNVPSVAWLRSAAGLLCLALFLATAPLSLAQQTQAPGTTEAPPQKVQQLLELLRDPGVQQWLERQPVAGQAAQPAAQTQAAQPQSMGGYFAQRLEYLR